MLFVKTWPGETERPESGSPLGGGGSRLGSCASVRTCCPCASRTQPPARLPTVAVSCPGGCGFHWGPTALVQSRAGKCATAAELG